RMARHQLNAASEVRAVVSPSPAPNGPRVPRTAGVGHADCNTSQRKGGRMPGLNDVLAGIAERRGDRATELPAVALSVTIDDGADPNDPQTLARPVVLIEPVVHPDLEALLDATSAMRRGRF